AIVIHKCTFCFADGIERSAVPLKFSTGLLQRPYALERLSHITTAVLGHSLLIPDMSLVNLAHVCSSLNNANKARLALASIPHTKLHLNICIALQQSGLISSIVRGGPTAPAPHLLLGHPTIVDEEAGAEPVTQSNVASRRLWVGLKYWQSEPVLGTMTSISTPKRKISVKLPDLRNILQGRRSGSVDGLRSPGECLYLKTDRGFMEARECVEKKVGGLALVRVN
ncbi:hypothetical protein Egran_00905, partial [Elaphomyces granulatus]